MLDYLWAAMLLLGIAWGIVQGKGAELTQAVLDGGKEAVSLALTMLGMIALWTGLMEIAEKCGLLRKLNRVLRPVIGWLFPHLPKDHPAAESISMNFTANMLGLGNAATPAALKAMQELQELKKERQEEHQKEHRAEHQKERQSEHQKEHRAEHQKKRQSEHQKEHRAEHQKEHQAEYKEKHQSEHQKEGKEEGREGSGQKKTKVHTAGMDEYTASDEMCTFLIINISSLQLIPVNMLAYRSQYGAVNPASIVVPVLIATIASTVVGVTFCKLCQRGSKRNTVLRSR